jgi:hypothetical protein
MTDPIKILSTAGSTIEGGRDGHARTDGRLEVESRATGANIDITLAVAGAEIARRGVSRFDPVA